MRPEVVTEAIAKQLAADGYEVTRIGEAWDPRSGSVPSVDADAVVGGVIEQFYGETDGRSVWSPVKAEVRPRVAVASPKRDRVVGESLIRVAIAQVPPVQGLEPSM